MNYYQHHIGDFNNATRHLTRVERSLYRDLIELYYDKEQPLTGDIKNLSRLVLAVNDDEKEALNVVLDDFFILKDGFYYNSRCESELVKYKANSSAKAKAGKASAEARRIAKEALLAAKSARVKQPLKSASTRVQQKATNQEPRTINQEPLTNKEKATEELPGSVNENAWLEFMQHRGTGKKKPSKLAKTKLINILKKHTKEDQQLLVDYSIAGGYPSLYPNQLKQGKNNAADKKPYKNAATTMHDTLKQIAKEADEREMG